MTKKSGADRREYPRIIHQLPLKVAVDGYDFVTLTRNVSCVGAYCHINKYMPPFTKVIVKLTLPIMTGRRNKSYKVECKGVVVRTEDEVRGGFNIAIFFNDITQEQKKKITQYISQLLPKVSAVLKIN